MRAILTTVLTAGLALPAAAEMANYELDPTHTAVYFTVDHIGYAKTLGIFTGVSGIHKTNGNKK